MSSPRKDDSHTSTSAKTEASKTPVQVSIVSGAVSGALSTFLLQPLDVLKTRAQVQHARSSYFAIAATVFRTDGVQGFWKGLTPSLARTVPGVGLYFGCISALSAPVETALGSGSTSSFVVGAGSRLLAGSLLLPFTLIKAQMESGLYNYTSLYHGFRHVVKTSGIRGLYRGTLVTALRDAPYSGLYMALYGALKDQDIPKVPAGLLAGVIASLVTQPLDVAKTLVQTNTQRASSLFAIIQFIFSEKLSTLFAGAGPRVLRRTLVSTISWTCYELLSPILRDVV